MTLEELKELNAIVARVHRAYMDWDVSKDPADYWVYHTMWVEARDGYGLEIPAKRSADKSVPALKPAG